MSLFHDGFETLVPDLGDDYGVLWQAGADYGITIAAAGGAKKRSVDVENGDKSFILHARDGDLSVGDFDCRVVGICLLDVACFIAKGWVFNYLEELLPTFCGLIFVQRSLGYVQFAIYIYLITELCYWRWVNYV